MSAVIGSLRADLSLRATAFNKGVDAATRKLNGLSRDFKRISRQLQGVGRSLTLGLTAPITAFGTLTLRAAGDFEASMNKVGAVSGATGEELIALRDIAKEMGATTQFSASQSADALSFLAMAGFDARQSIDALPGTLQLAASAQMDLASAADIVSNVLAGYGLQVSELSRVNDVLVKTFTSANTDLRQLGEAMRYAGPIASAAGVSFEEAAAAIGLMGNAGIQSSMAGTSLRGAIGRILEPTAKATAAMRELGLNFTDSAGRLISFDQIISQLAPHADDAGLFMELFGQRAGPAMAALVSQGEDALVSLRTELENSGGTAARIAVAQMKGFNGAMKRLASAFEAVRLAIADSGLLDFATRMANRMAELFTKLSKVNPELLKIGTIVAGVALAVGPLVLAAGALSAGLASVLPLVTGLAVPFTALASAAGLVALAWGPLTAAIDWMRENVLLLSPLIGQLSLSLTVTLAGALGVAAKGFTGLAVASGFRLVSALKLATAGMKAFRLALISTGFGALIVGAGTLIAKFVELIDKTGSFGNALSAVKTISLEVTERVRLGFDALVATIKAAGFRMREVGGTTAAAIVEVMGAGANRIIGAFVGAFDAVIAAWSALPAMFSRFGALAANALIESVERGIQGLVGPLNDIAEFLDWDARISIDLSEYRRDVGEAIDVAGRAKDAFNDAFNTDYTGPLSEGLRETASEFGNAADEAEGFAKDAAKAAVAPLKSLQAINDEAALLGREARAAGRVTEGALDGVTDRADVATDSMTDLAEAAEEVGDSAERGGRRAGKALGKVAKDAEEAKNKIGKVFRGFADDIVSGDIGGAFKNLFTGIVEEGARAFGDLLKSAFTTGGGGVAEVFTGLKSSVTGIGSALSGIFSGGAGLGGILTGVGGLIGKALPVIGAVSTVFRLIKSFKSTKIIGGGLKLGIEDGDLIGGTFSTVQKSKFWGAKKKTFDVDKPFDEQTSSAFRAQVTGIQSLVRASYETLGLSVSNKLIRNVNLAIQRINTTGLSEDQIQAKIDEVFLKYADALSEAVGGLGLELATNLAQVQALLTPLGNAFDLTGLKDSFTTVTEEVVPEIYAGLADALKSAGAPVKKKAIKAGTDINQAVVGVGRNLSVAADKLRHGGENVTQTTLQAFEIPTETITRKSSALLNAAAQAAKALTDLAGGIKSLTDKTTEFYKRFFSEEEKLEHIRTNVSATFERLNLAVPKTDLEFRKLVLSQNLMTDAGRRAYNTLLDIAPQFDVLTDAAEQAAAAELALITSMKDARDDALFDLLDDGSQVSALRDRISELFDGLGLSVPETRNEMREIIQSLNLSTEEGRDVWTSIRDIIPGFERVIDTQTEAAETFRKAVAELRGVYELDPARYQTELEAKLAHELSNAGQFSDELIDAQNSELRRQSDLLGRVVQLLTKQNKISDDSNLLAGIV